MNVPRLNADVNRERWPLPHKVEILDEVKGSTVSSALYFSKVTIKSRWKRRGKRRRLSVDVTEQFNSKSCLSVL